MLTPDRIPHNWLQQKLTIKEAEDNYKQTCRYIMDRWNDFFSSVQEGDEIWVWQANFETANLGKTVGFPFGLCIIRKGKVIKLFPISIYTGM